MIDRRMRMAPPYRLPRSGGWIIQRPALEHISAFASISRVRPDSKHYAMTKIRTSHFMQHSRFLAAGSVDEFCVANANASFIAWCIWLRKLSR
jgi:hypothetical protein